MKVALSLLLVAGCASAEVPGSFYEDFSNGIDPKKWVISTWTAPRSAPSNRSSFASRHVYIKDGVLCLELKQVERADGTYTSRGAELTSIAKFGYGTYEIVLKASSDNPDPTKKGNPVSGSITGVSQYLDFSATEIDVEMEGIATRNELTQTTTWVGEDLPSESHKVPPAVEGDLPHQRFFTYRFVWVPGKVQFFRDGVLISTHTKVVPTKEAPVIFNHWGTNDPAWGGWATPGTSRYMFIKSFSFTPV